MTVTLIKPAPVFGVRFAASVDRVTHVDEYTNEARARRFLGALHFMGNADAELVRRDTTAGSWVPVEVTQ
jgi:hypothetical protein